MTLIDILKLKMNDAVGKVMLKSDRCNSLGQFI